MSGRKINRAQGIRHSGEVAVEFKGEVSQEGDDTHCTVVVGKLAVYFAEIGEVGEMLRTRAFRMGDYVFLGWVKMYLPLDNCDMMEIVHARHVFNPLRLKDNHIHYIVREAFGTMEEEAQLPNPSRRGSKKPKSKKRSVNVRSLVSKALK